jgi:hypothetical protein
MTFGRTVEKTAFGIVGCLAITRKRLPSGLGMHVTKQRLLHGVHVTIFLWVIKRRCQNQEYTASNGGITAEWLIRKDLDGSAYGLIEVLSRNLPVKTAGVPVEILTEYLPNINPERYRSIILLQDNIWCGAFISYKQAYNNIYISLILRAILLKHLTEPVRIYITDNTYYIFVNTTVFPAGGVSA